LLNQTKTNIEMLQHDFPLCGKSNDFFSPKKKKKEKKKRERDYYIFFFHIHISYLCKISNPKKMKIKNPNHDMCI
jgi:hypothetical protein